MRIAVKEEKYIRRFPGCVKVRSGEQSSRVYTNLFLSRLDANGEPLEAPAKAVAPSIHHHSDDLVTWELDKVVSGMSTFEVGEAGAMRFLRAILVPQ